jgi:hypothetical protein
MQSCSISCHTQGYYSTQVWQNHSNNLLFSYMMQHHSSHVSTTLFHCREMSVLLFRHNSVTIVKSVVETSVCVCVCVCVREREREREREEWQYIKYQTNKLTAHQEAVLQHSNNCLLKFFILAGLIYYFKLEINWISNYMHWRAYKVISSQTVIDNYVDVLNTELMRFNCTISF